MSYLLSVNEKGSNANFGFINWYVISYFVFYCNKLTFKITKNIKKIRITSLLFYNVNYTIAFDV